MKVPIKLFSAGVVLYFLNGARKIYVNCLDDRQSIQLEHLLFIISEAI